MKKNVCRGCDKPISGMYKTFKYKGKKYLYCSKDSCTKKLQKFMADEGCDITDANENNKRFTLELNIAQNAEEDYLRSIGEIE